MTWRSFIWTCMLLAALLAGRGAQASETGGELLPAGYLSALKSQIVDSAGHRVRLACVGYDQPSANLAADMRAIVNYGFNCLRFPWYDRTMAADIETAGQIVAAAKLVGLKVILDHHGDEAPSAANGYLPYPCNGLPFDLGPGTSNVDGCGDSGTVDLATFVADWVVVAQYFAGNSTVIGFDLTNEPHLSPSWYADNPGGATWGDGSATDLQAIYIQVGDAIQAVNPNALIICEGVMNWTGSPFRAGAAYITGYADLSLAAEKPVTLTFQDKLVYSVHDYPKPISAVAVDSGAAKIKAMNASWGYLVSQHIAPVWIGEMGASLDKNGADTAQAGELADEQKWLDTLIPYMNGLEGALGGPEFAACAQPIGGDWWRWGSFTGESPDGVLLANGKPRPQQLAAATRIRFVRKPGC